MIHFFKRFCSAQTPWVALILSVVLHALIFLIVYIQPESEKQASLGSGKVILLEHVEDKPTKISDQLSDTQAASQKSDAIQKQGLNGKNNAPNKESQTNTIKVVSPHAVNQQAKITSNQGSVALQSGTDQTAFEQYRQRVISHLLNKIKNAPTHGQAVIHLHILTFGMATQVKIELITGTAQYQTWLNRQVLNANPMPPFPSSIKKASLQLAIPIRHHTEP